MNAKARIAMPTVLKEGSYRFFFYSGDRQEPPHVHVTDGDRIAKFWLDPVRMQGSGGLRRSELNKIQRIVERNRGFFQEAWNDYFDD